MSPLALRFLAGLVGFYAGLFALLSATGLGEAEWAPVAMLAGAALVGTATVGFMAKLPTPTVLGFAAAAAAVGALLGGMLGTIRDGFEWTIIVGVALMALAVLGTDAAADRTA